MQTSPTSSSSTRCSPTPGRTTSSCTTRARSRSLSDTTWNRKQFYSVTRVDRHGWQCSARTCPARRATSARTRSRATRRSPPRRSNRSGSGGKVFAGQRAEGFYFDLGSDLRPRRPASVPARLPAQGAGSEPGINTLAGLNVHSIAIQVPISELTSDGTRPVELQRPTTPSSASGRRPAARRAVVGGSTGFHAGPWVQVSRLGNPLINEVIIPMGQKDYWNHQARPTTPSSRASTTTRRLPSLLNVLYPGVFPNIAAYTANSSNTRPDLDAVLLTGVPAGLFAGFQNYTGTTKADLLRLNVAIAPDGALLGQHPRRRGRRQRRVPERASRLRRRRQRRAEGRGGGAAPRRRAKLHARRCGRCAL